MSLVVNSKRRSALRGPPCETVTCIIISLVSAACSIHSNWEVVVRDGALPGGGGMQDAPWQLWLDVLRWQQDQNHQGKITSHDRGKWDVGAEQKRTAPRCSAWHRQNNVFGMNSAVKSKLSLNLSSFFFLLEHAAIHHINVLTLWKRCDGTPLVRRLICRSASSFLQMLGSPSPAPFIALFCKTHISCFVFVCLFSAVTGPIITKTMNHLLLS